MTGAVAAFARGNLSTAPIQRHNFCLVRRQFRREAKLLWYAIVVCSAGLLFWNRRLRGKVKRIQGDAPDRYEAARSACLKLDLSSTEFTEKLLAIPLGHMVLTVSSFSPEAAPHWPDLPKSQKDAAVLMLMADSLSRLELGYIRLFMSERERKLLDGLKTLDLRELRK
jgi:hypothetical protein